MKKQVLLIALGAALITPVWAQENGEEWRVTRTVVEVTEKKAPPKAEVYRTLIIVDNRAGAEFNDEVARFESEVAAGVGDMDFLSIISRDDVVKGQKVYDGEAPTASSPEDYRAQKESAWRRLNGFILGREEKISGTATTDEDWKTARSSTAINMAEVLGADLVLAVSLDSVNVENKAYSGNGINAQNVIYTLRGTYKLLDINFGGTIISAPLKATKTVRQTEGLKVGNTGIIADMMEKAAADIAKDIKGKKAKVTALKINEVMEVAVSCTAQDMKNTLSLPNIYMNEDGKVHMESVPLEVELVATVELDGFAVGTTPCTIKARPGVHKLRVVCPGFKDYAGNVKVSEDGMKLDIPLQMTEAGLARWKGMQLFATTLKTGAVLTSAEVEKIRGEAEMLRNSYFQITELPDIHVHDGAYRSLYNNNNSNIIINNK